MSTAQRIDGKAAAALIVARAKEAGERLRAETGIRPGLAVVLVGSDPASEVYVASKGRMARECGFHSLTHTLDASTGEADLVRVIREINRDPEVHGILQQLPLPPGIDPDAVIQRIAPEKDVDGLTYLNAGRVAEGMLDEAFVPCTPAGCMVLVKTVLGEDLSGRTAVVVGRSRLVGKPMAHLLLAANATVTVAHSRTRDLPEVCRAADILVAAVGRPEMIRGDWIKPGAVVIDVGINRIAAPERGEGMTRLVGDVAYEEALPQARAITPVPGGVGPMTIAMLMANTVIAAYRAAGRTPPRF